MKNIANILRSLLYNPNTLIHCYSPLCGVCTVIKIGATGLIYIQSSNSDVPIVLNEYGQYTERGECLLFPSKGNNDWFKFKSYSFKPFEKVIVRDNPCMQWYCDFFSHISHKNSYVCVGGIYNHCLPYNEITSHLVGTTDNYE